MNSKEENNLYEVFQSLPPELQKEFFRQLEISQNELKEKLLSELDQIKSELQEFKKELSSHPPDREDGDELINRTIDVLIEENKKYGL